MKLFPGRTVDCDKKVRVCCLPILCDSLCNGIFLAFETVCGLSCETRENRGVQVLFFQPFQMYGKFSSQGKDGLG